MALSRDGVDLLLPLAVGTAMTLATIFIHASGLVTIVRFVRRERRLGYAGVHFWKDTTIVAASHVGSARRTSD